MEFDTFDLESCDKFWRLTGGANEHKRCIIRG